MRILLVASLFLLQDSPEALIRKLAEGSLEEREQATERLILLGEAARSDLKKALASNDATLGARAEQILKVIDIRKEMQPFRSAPTRVTLSGERTLEEAAAELSKASGRPVTCDSWPAGTFRIELKETLFWEALEAVCAASRLRTPEITREGVKLTGTRYVRKPHLEWEGVTIRIDALERGRHFDIENGTEKQQFAIRLVVACDRSITPAYEYWEIHSAIDDQGVNHRKAIYDFDSQGTAGMTLSAEDPAPRSSEEYWLVTETPLGDKCRTIRELKGRIVLWAKASSDSVSFATPRADVEEDIEVPERVSVFDPNLMPKQDVQLTLFNMGRNCADLRVEGVDRRMFRKFTYLSYLTDKNKQRYPGYVREEEEAPTVLEFSFFGLPEEAAADRIALRLPKRVIQIEIPFAFEDLPVN